MKSAQKKAIDRNNKRKASSPPLPVEGPADFEEPAPDQPADDARLRWGADGSLSTGAVAKPFDTAHYIRDMLVELRHLASGAELHSLKPSLDQALEEANTTLTRLR